MTATATIRLVDSADLFADALRCINLAMPARSKAVHEVRASVAGWPWDDSLSWVAEQDGRVVGAATMGGVAAANGIMFVAADPAAQRRGIGLALAQAAFGALPSDRPNDMAVFVDGDDARAVEFARRWGYELPDRPPQTWIMDVAGRSPVADLGRAVDGIKFERLTVDRLSDAALIADLYEGHAEAEADESAGDCGYETPEALTSNYRERIEDGGAVVVALDVAGRVVGVTIAHRGYEAPAAFVWVTFVRRSHRGNGIALALKAELHKWARENGIRWLWAMVFHENEAMRGVQRRAGWRPSRVGLAHRNPNLRV